MAKRGYRFEIKHKTTVIVGPKQRFHIKLLAGNNEIVLSGEQLGHDPHATVQAIVDGIPKYTTASYKPKFTTQGSTRIGGRGVKASI